MLSMIAPWSVTSAGSAVVGYQRWVEHKDCIGAARLRSGVLDHLCTGMLQSGHQVVVLLLGNGEIRPAGVVPQCRVVHSE
jgi:hypothetical protein